MLSNRLPRKHKTCTYTDNSYGTFSLLVRFVESEARGIVTAGCISQIKANIWYDKRKPLEDTEVVKNKNVHTTSDYTDDPHAPLHVMRFIHTIRVAVLKTVRQLPIPILGGATFMVFTICIVGFQNYQANALLHTAQKADAAAHYSQAKKELDAIKQFAVWPSIRRGIQAEQKHNEQLLSLEQKLHEVQQLLKEHKTAAAQQLLKSIHEQTSNSSNGLQSQTAQLQNAVNAQTKSSTSGHTSSSGSSPKPVSSGGGTGSGGSGGSSGGGSSGGSIGGGSGPPGPMSAITINSFSPSVSPFNASSCSLSESVNFSVNGSGSVQVVWEQLSSKTSSSIDNPVTYTFSAAGSQTDSTSIRLQGLESGDSYRISVTITDTTDSNITTTVGPATFSTCAAPPSLQSPNQPSFMTQPVTPTSLTASQSQDPLFSNECSVNVQSSFSVTGPGSVQVVYTITSTSSIGATLYSLQQEDFSGPGSSTDSSYIRLPHLPGGGSYSISAKFNVLGDPSHDATSGPITSACS